MRKYAQKKRFKPPKPKRISRADQRYAEAHRQAEIVRAQLAQPPTETARALRPGKASPVVSPAQVEGPTQPPVCNAVLQDVQRQTNQLEAEPRQMQGKLDAWNDGGGDDVLSTPAALIAMLDRIHVKAQSEHFWSNDGGNAELVKGFMVQLQNILSTAKAIKL
jgi:hypothetical protein